MPGILLGFGNNRFRLSCPPPLDERDNYLSLSYSVYRFCRKCLGKKFFQLVSNSELARGFKDLSVEKFILGNEKI